MNFRYLIFGLILIINGCAQNSYQIEDHLYECIDKRYKADNINLKSAISDFELFLINNGILKGKSGSDYVNFFKEVKKNNDIISKIDPDILERLCKIPISDYYSDDCMDKLNSLDSAIIFDSKYFKLQLVLQNQNPLDEISPSNMAESILSVLTAKDFEHKYYKCISLIMIAFTSDVDIGILQQLPELSESEEAKTTISEDNNLLVVIDSSNCIYINDTLFDLTKVKQKVSKFISNNSEYLIILHNKKGTSYDFYLKVQTEMTNAYNDLRDLESIRLYDKKYSDLEKNQKDVIRKKYPYRIVESEPK